MSSYTCSRISGLKPLIVSVKLIYFLSVLIFGSATNLFCFIAICLYAAGNIWKMLRHHLKITLCNLIALGDSNSCYFCCCQSNYMWEYSTKVLLFDLILFHNNSICSVLILIDSLSKSLFIFTERDTTFFNAPAFDFVHFLIL